MALADRQIRPRPQKLITAQPATKRLLKGLLPCLVGAVFFFGWRVLALLIWISFVGLTAEWLSAYRRKQPLSLACLATCMLLVLSLPPEIPIWIATIGILVAVLLGKEAFGGYGRNAFNPALVGWAFVFICFPASLSTKFAPAFKGFPAGLTKWSMSVEKEPPAWLTEAGVKTGADALTSATPMSALRDHDHPTALRELFVGDIGGVFDASGSNAVLAAGCVGEVSALLVLIGGAYVVLTGAANWRIVASVLVGVAACSMGLEAAKEACATMGPASACLAGALPGGGGVPGGDFLASLPSVVCSGAVLFGAFFMATDPVTAPKARSAQILYGLIIGALVVLLRTRSAFYGGVAFAILAGNAIAPLLDLALKGDRAQDARSAGRAGK